MLGAEKAVRENTCRVDLAAISSRRCCAAVSTMAFWKMYCFSTAAQQVDHTNVISSMTVLGVCSQVVQR